MNVDRLSCQGKARRSEIETPNAFVARIGRPGDQPAHFQLWKQHRDIRAANKEFARQLLLRQSGKTERIQKNIKMRRLQVQRTQRLGQSALNGIVPAHQGNPVLEAGIIPGQGLFFVHC